MKTKKLKKRYVFLFVSVALVTVFNLTPSGKPRIDFNPTYPRLGFVDTQEDTTRQLVSFDFSGGNEDIHFTKSWGREVVLKSGNYRVNGYEFEVSREIATCSQEPPQLAVELTSQDWFQSEARSIKGRFVLGDDQLDGIVNNNIGFKRIELGMDSSITDIPHKMMSIYESDELTDVSEIVSGNNPKQTTRIQTDDQNVLRIYRTSSNETNISTQLLFRNSSNLYYFTGNIVTPLVKEEQHLSCVVRTVDFVTDAFQRADQGTQ